MSSTADRLVDGDLPAAGLARWRATMVALRARPIPVAIGVGATGLLLWMFVSDPQKFLTFTIIGLVTGSIYSIAASGLVVTYTTSGIFNFAHGAIGMLMAFVYWQLTTPVGLPPVVAFVLTVFVAAPVLGAVLERVLIRRVQGSSVSTTLVVTVALLLGFMGTASVIWPPTEGRSVDPFFADVTVQLAGVNVTAHQIVTLVASAMAAAALYYILNRTRLGVAMRAVVDNRTLVALNGAAPARIGMMSWALGATLAALAGVLLASVVSLNILVLTLLVVNAYAAAMVGRLKSLPLTFVGAILLGLLIEYYRGFVFDLFPDADGGFREVLDGLAPSMPILLLFAALMFLPSERLRTGPLAATEAPRVPGLVESVVGAVVLVAATIVVSHQLGVADQARLAGGVALAIVMLSLVPLTGYAAQVSLAQLSFAGVGAFVVGRWFGDGSPIGFVLAALVAGAVGVVVALPALRLQGLFLALTTLAFAVFMDNMFFGQSYGFGLGGAMEVGRPRLLGLSVSGEQGYLVLLAVVFGAFGVGVLALKRSVFGRRLVAMRDSPAACATLGLNLTATKMAVFGISAAMAGVGGALFAGLRGSAGSGDFRLEQSLVVLLLVVIGGVTTVSGALVGGLLYAGLTSFSQGTFFVVIATSTLMLGKNPNGLAYLLSSRTRRYVRLNDRSPVSDGTVEERANEERTRPARSGPLVMGDQPS